MKSLITFLITKYQIICLYIQLWANNINISVVQDAKKSLGNDRRINIVCGTSNKEVDGKEEALRAELKTLSDERDELNQELSSLTQRLSKPIGVLWERNMSQSS